MEVLTNEVFEINGNANSSTKFLNLQNKSQILTRNTVSPVLLTFSNGIIPLIQKLNTFSNLEQGWDGYSADKPSIVAINAATDFLMQNQQYSLPFYFLAPGVNGEVMIEFKQDEKAAELYFNPDSSTELVLFESDEVILEKNLKDGFDQMIHFFNE